MNHSSRVVRTAFLLLIPAAVFPSVAQTATGVFTGAEAGEGLDLQGDIVVAYHMGGGPFTYDAGDARFRPDSGLMMTGADEVIDNWAAPDFGLTVHDMNLAEAMRSIRHNGREHGTMTLTDDRTLAVGETYKVQLLFIEAGPSPRRFDIAVGGVTVLPAFTLPAATDPPVAWVVTHTFVATDRDLVVTLDGLPLPDEAGVDTNPILSALTLEHCTPYTAVVTNTNDSGPGSLRKAIADGTGCPSTITFAPALNNQNIVLTSGPLEITGTNLTIIDASTLSSGLAISGNNASRVFHTGPGCQVRLTRLSLWQGTGLPASGAVRNGGAILNEGTLTLDRCTLFQNTAIETRGAALYNSGTATLSACLFSQNTSLLQIGGGIFNDTTGHLSLTDCNVYQNQAASGGGVVNLGTAQFTGCTFLENTTYIEGGGMINHGTAVFKLCTLAQNVTGDVGGALFNDGSATLTECTLTGNSVTETRGSPHGGGISHAATGNSKLTLDHCLIAGNTTKPGVPGSDVFAASAVTASWSLIGNGDNSGILNGNKGCRVGGGALPLIPAGLGPLEFNGGTTPTALPLPGCAAIDAGDPAVFPPAGSTDQRGGRRRRGASQDIGAVESMPDLSGVRMTLFPPSGNTRNFQVLVPVDVGPLFAQTSTNLSTWTTLVLTETGTPGLFTIPYDPAEKRRFYRVAEVP